MQMVPQTWNTSNVRLGSIATELSLSNHVRFSPFATELRTSLEVRFVPTCDILRAKEKPPEGGFS
jgi:hypothetical protein